MILCTLRGRAAPVTRPWDPLYLSSADETTSARLLILLDYRHLCTRGSGLAFCPQRRSRRWCGTRPDPRLPATPVPQAPSPEGDLRSVWAAPERSHRCLTGTTCTMSHADVARVLKSAEREGRVNGQPVRNPPHSTMKFMPNQELHGRSPTNLGRVLSCIAHSAGRTQYYSIFGAVSGHMMSGCLRWSASCPLSPVNKGTEKATSGLASKLDHGVMAAADHHAVNAQVRAVGRN